MPAFELLGQHIAPGTTARLELPCADLYTGAAITMPVHVIHTKKPGPVVFISAAIHGDELNGIEIVRRLIQQKTPKLTAGTLIAVPMVNVYGVLNHSRYLPDRRDLNRSFPGSAKGSLAGRVADRFLNEIVAHCDYGIDLHTGAIHRSNLPQIRADLSDPETHDLACAFGVPVVLDASIRDGSLRGAAGETGTKVLLYEAGQALRFDELSIKAGIKGINHVLSHLGMVKLRSSRAQPEPFIAYNTAWLRAPCSGIVRDLKRLGDAVEGGEALAEIGSPFGEVLAQVLATKPGVIIGKQNIPLVHEGDAMYHLAFFKDDDSDVADRIESVHDDLRAIPNQAAYSVET